MSLRRDAELGKTIMTRKNIREGLGAFFTILWEERV